MENSGLFIRKAAAGSGKTRSLIDRVLALLNDEDEVGPVVVATYTREAAAEIHQRLTRYGGVRRVGHRLMVGTLHSVAGRAMNHYRRQKGLQALKIHGDGRTAAGLVEIIALESLKSIHLAQELKSARVNFDPATLARRFVCLIDLLPSASSYSAEELAPYFNSEYLAEFAARCLRRWRREVANLPFSDYARILTDVTAVMRAEPDERNLLAPQHVALDEFQDISPRQFEFIDALCRNATSLYLVGCPDQSIYNFRAGGVIPFDEIPDRLDLSRHLRSSITALPQLDRSYRCPEAIARASRALLSHNVAGMTVPMNGHASGAICTGWFPDEQDEVDAVSGSIGRMAADTFGGLAILGRTHQAVEPHFLALVGKQVPVRIMRTDDPIGAAVLERVSLWLRLALSPSDIDAAKKVLAFGFENLGPATLSKIERALARREAAFRTLRLIGGNPDIRRPQAKAIMDVAAKFERTAYVLKRAKTLGEWLQWMIQTLPGAFQPNDVAEEECRPTLEFVFRLAQSCETAGRFLDALAPPSNSDHVTVGTFHAAKGREWDSVFIVSACRTTLEGLHARCQDTLFAAGILDGGIDGERRLLHVAMTRARQNLIVSWSGGPQGASRFIQQSGLPINQDPGIRVPQAGATPASAPHKAASKQLLLF